MDALPVAAAVPGLAAVAYVLLRMIRDYRRDLEALAVKQHAVHRASIAARHSYSRNFELVRSAAKRTCSWCRADPGSGRTCDTCGAPNERPTPPDPGLSTWH